MFSFLIRIQPLVPVILLSKLEGVNTQHTEAVCNVSSLSFSFNSKGQSPCLVGAYLSAPCSSDGDYDIPSIGPGYRYGPSDVPDMCLCSTVTYSLSSACAACQGGTIGPWSEWTTNCTIQNTSPDGEYPIPIPFGTAVPAWAYQLVFSSNRFNVSLAQSVGDSPEHTPVVPTSSSTSSSSSAQSTQTSSSSSASISAQSTNATSSSLGGGGSNHTGAIAGGVAGGVVGIALIGGLFAFLIIRSNRNQYQQESTYRPSGTVAYSSNNEEGKHRGRSMSNYSATPVTPSSPSSGAGSPVALNMGRQGGQMDYPSGHWPQPSLQGTSISENPHNPNNKLGSANDSDRLAVY